MSIALKQPINFRIDDPDLLQLVMAMDSAHHLEKLSEESRELCEESARACRVEMDEKQRSRLLGEVADVLICIDHVLDVLDVSNDEMQIYYDFKVRRQLNREARQTVIKYREEAKKAAPARVEDREAWMLEE